MPWPISLELRTTVVRPSGCIFSHTTGEKSPAAPARSRPLAARRLETERESRAADRDDAQKIFTLECGGHATPAADLIADLMRG